MVSRFKKIARIVYHNILILYSSFERSISISTKGLIYKIFGLRLGHLKQFSPKKLNIVAFSKQKLTHYKGNLRLSIVIPNLNQGAYIGQTLISIVEQNFKNLELIIQDGGSTDDSLEIIDKYKNRIDHLYSGKDRGQASAINSGFMKSSGDIMAWINSDDIYMPGTFDRVMILFEDHPNVDVIYGNRLLIDCDGKHIGNWVLPYHDGDALAWADYIPQETLFWRRRVWDTIGSQIDESFQFALDWDLLLKFKNVNANFLHVPFFLACFRIHEVQKSSAELSTFGVAEMNKIRMRIHGRIPSEEEIHIRLKKFFYDHKIADLFCRLRMIFCDCLNSFNIFHRKR